jgi:D-lactate dehydrogenase
MSEQMSDALWRWSDGGKLPVVVDAASCTLGLKDDILEHLDDERKDRLNLITIVDSIAWCKDLLPSLKYSKKDSQNPRASYLFDDTPRPQ